MTVAAQKSARRALRVVDDYHAVEPVNAIGKHVAAVIVVDCQPVAVKVEPRNVAAEIHHIAESFPLAVIPNGRRHIDDAVRAHAAGINPNDAVI